MPRPFRFGAIAASGGPGPQWLGAAASRQTWREKARRIESLGYDVLLLADHFADLLAPMPALVAAAEATTRLRLGTFVLDNDFRHPVMLARDAATVDLLTDGRLEIGIGAGWQKDEYEQAGLAFEPGPVRAGRLEESVTILKGLFRGEPFSHQGRHYQLKELAGWPVPVQRPHPPLLIGGGGRRLLTLAAREANVVGLAPRSLPAGGLDVSDVTAEATARKVGWVREAAGARFADLELNALVFMVDVTEDRRASAERVSAGLGMAPEVLLDSPHLLLGTPEQIAESLQERRERFGISYVAVFEPAAEALAPVVARLVGT